MVSESIAHVAEGKWTIDSEVMRARGNVISDG